MTFPYNNANKGILSVFLIVLFLFTGCGGGGSDNNSSGGTGDSSTGTTDPGSSNELATIYRDATYNVNVDYDLVYGQGLSHSSWDADDGLPMDLKLDAYVPENDETRRPAMMFIHGGGFRGGSKLSQAPAGVTRYFAERGFVGFSIDYRVLGDYGSIPDAIKAMVDANSELSTDDKDQAKAIYPAVRDAKAALRWIVANADQYGIDTDYITIAGGSAGAITAIALGVSDAADFTHELSHSEDSTLSSTNLTTSVEVKAAVDYWGGPAAVNLLTAAYGINPWDETDTPLSIIHGTEDPTVLYEEAEKLVDTYQQTGAYYELYTLNGVGHGAWHVNYEGRSMPELGFDFATRMLEVSVEEN